VQWCAQRVRVGESMLSDQSVRRVRWWGDHPTGWQSHGDAGQCVYEKRAPDPRKRSVPSEAEGASGGDGEGERRQAGGGGSARIGSGWASAVPSTVPSDDPANPRAHLSGLCADRHGTGRK